MAIGSFRDLIVWQRAMDFVAGYYRATGSFPSEERIGLSSQLRRAAVSIPSNIVEGHGRGHVKAFLNHLRIANGSLRESETQHLIAERLGSIQSDALATLLELAGEVGKLITGLRRSLETNLPLATSPGALPPPN